MESWLVVVFIGLAGQAFGLPKAMDSETVLRPRMTSADQSSWNNGMDRRFSIAMPLDSQALKRSPFEEEGVEAMVVRKPASPDTSSRMMEEKRETSEEQSKVLPDLTGDTLNQQLPEDARQATSEAEDAVRAKKSTSAQDVPGPHVPQTTTVCIQLRSEHQQGVVCGNPLSDAKKVGDPGTKARFAYRTPNDYYPHTFGQTHLSYMDPNSFARASPLDTPDMISDRNRLVNQVPLSPMGMSQSPGSIQGPSRIGQHPTARDALPVSMYPLRRNDEDPSSAKTGESPGLHSQAGASSAAPIRLPPGYFPSSPNSVIVHKQFYPYPQGYVPNIISPPAHNPFRLNCAPDGGYIPYLRSGQPAGFIPVEERVFVNPMASRMAEGPQFFDDQQAYFVDPQARQAGADNILGTPFTPDGLSGALFIDEDGQAYIMQDSQGRSASSEQAFEQNQLVGEGAKEDMGSKARRQEEELQRSKEKLHELEQQLKHIKEKAALDAEKKEIKQDQPDGTNNSQHVESNTTIPDKTELAKNAKRNVIRHTIIHT